MNVLQVQIDNCSLPSPPLRSSSLPISYYLNQYFIDHQDPRTMSLPIINISIWTMFLILLCYLYSIKKLIPLIMKNHEPIHLKKTMLVYNITMVLANAFFFSHYINRLNRLFDFVYPKVDCSEESFYEIKILYLYFGSKFMDWFDTVFLVLKKKHNHISFLHLYHHTMVPLVGWLFLKINPLIPAIALFGVINSFIHVVMYSYYALASFGPSIQKYLWWKKYITQMQMIQFIIYIGFATLIAINHVGYPKFWLYFGYTQPPLFLYMFYDFYTKSYHKSDLKKQA